MPIRPLLLRCCARYAPLLVLALFLAVAPSSGNAQLKIYAQFADGTGVWAGESTAANRTGWVELDSVSFGTTNTTTLGSGSGGAGGGKAKFDSIELSKAIDRVTPQIFSTLTTGGFVAGLEGVVTVEFVRQIGGVDRVVFKVEMKAVAFTRQQTSVGDGDDRLVENVTMQCGAMRITYPRLNPDGSPTGPPIEREWSIVLNNPTFNVQ